MSRTPRLCAFALAATCLCAVSGARAVDVTTRAFDNNRSGWNSAETTFKNNNLGTLHLTRTFDVDEKVEAQPLVLLEAMASGCAIITTSVGEIPTILEGASAIFLAEGTADELSAALARLAAEPETIGRLARAAHQRFLANHEHGRHLGGWEARIGAGHADREPEGLPVTSKS